VIKTFASQATAHLFAGQRVAQFANIATVAQRKLQQIDCAATLDGLRVPPGNRLEALAGKRKGQHSMRINDQWRVCFVWRSDGVHDVEIVDYH
jgi:proteic killer suppression protein